MGSIKVDCSYNELVPLEKLVPHPRNSNRHSVEQIEVLAKLIKAHGFRYPIVVSKRSGFVISGHGRIDALRLLKEEKAPVNFQDFVSEAEEFQVLTSDNEIARWAELDYQSVYDALKEIPDLDVDLLGIEDFKEKEKDKKDKEVDLKFDYKLEIDCLDEDKQQMILLEMQDRGFKVRVLL